MVPRQLVLRNFMSYGEGPNLLDFTGWHIACMSGSNGHGKSALFDAVTWALWGRCRAKREDDVVRQGATNAEVEFEFGIGEGVYRVVRKRTIRRSAGQTTLELHVRYDGAWKTATGATVNETQAAILTILRLSYDTFINSAFLMQGRADEFTIKPPGDRKKVLGEILGLGRYDELAERARAVARERELALKEARSRLDDLDTAIAAEPLVLNEEREVERQVTQNALDQSEQSTQLRRLQDRREDLQRAATALQAARRRYGELANLVVQDEERCAKLELFIAKCDLLIAQSDEITRGHAELQAARATLEAMNQVEVQRMRLHTRILELERAISAIETGVRAEVEKERRQAAQHRGLADKVPQLSTEIGALTIHVAGLPLAEKTLAEVRARREEASATVAALESENDALGKQRTTLRDRLKLLKGSDALCPVCRTPLGPEQRREVEASYVAEGTGLKARQEANEQRIRALCAEVDRLGREEPLQVGALRKLQQTAGQLENVRAQLGEAQEAEARALEADRRAAVVEARLGTPEVAPVEHAELGRVRGEFATIDYDEGRHQALRCRVGELGEFTERYERLQTARTERGPRQEQVHDLRTNLLRFGGERSALETEIAALEQRAGDSLALDEQIRARMAALGGLEETGRGLQQRLGDLRGALRRIAVQRQERQELAARHATLEKEQSAYTDLGHAFGRQGIQAMLIDAVLPEIENVANEILSRMTDNSVHVQFSTQRTGTAGNVVETLDIRISDSAGTRSYEMFSGGEAFRVNFAIRIALSRLLAGRAGASLHTLIIDEGFGSQDGAGRERLIEAITSVAGDFEKIVVITHLEELKEFFPVRIDVFKGVGGSQIVVSE
jgi:exonuclease SbcC